MVSVFLLMGVQTPSTRRRDNPGNPVDGVVPYLAAVSFASVVRRSSFVVRRSSFVVRRSSFVARRSSFLVPRRVCVPAVAAALLPSVQ